MKAMEKQTCTHSSHKISVGWHAQLYAKNRGGHVSRIVPELIYQITVTFKNHHNNIAGPNSLVSSFPADKPCRTNQASRTPLASLLLHLLKQTQPYFKKHVCYSICSL